MGKSIKIGISILFILYLSCNSPTQPPPPGSGLLTLTLAENSCTEAWIEVKTNSVTLPVNVNLLSNNSLLMQLNNLHSSDTTIYIDSLLPNKSYQLQATFSEGFLKVNSNKLAIQTLDTTNNKYSWQTFTVGGKGGSSIFQDIAIIDDNNIWAVGAIYMDDSTGNIDPVLYNLAIWDGVSWKLQRIRYQGGVPEILSILAFNRNDIWLDPWFHWDGQNFQALPIDTVLLGWRANKMWGTSSSDIYVVGDYGNIVHYDGSAWRKVKSISTTYPNTSDFRLTDIYGDSQNIYTCGYSSDYGKSILLKYKNGRFEEVWSSIYATATPPFSDIVPSIWDTGKLLYVISDTGIYQVFNSDLKTTKHLMSIYAALYRIRGTEANNIAAAGDGGIIWHYNGLRWTLLQGSYSEAVTLYTVDIKGNIIVAAGTDYNISFGKAIIQIGSR